MVLGGGGRWQVKFYTYKRREEGRGWEKLSQVEGGGVGAQRIVG